MRRIKQNINNDNDNDIERGKKMIVGAVAGAVVGAVAGAAAYSDYSDHYDYSRYSEYSDADVVLEIEKKERELKAAQKSLETKQRLLQEQIEDELETIKQELDLPEYVSEYTLQEAINRKYRDMLKEEIEQDQLKVQEIDEVINKILNIQLKA